jgi:Protein of unknown function (DUF3455)
MDRRVLLLLPAAALIAACASAPMNAPKATSPISPYTQAALPAVVQVPAGHRVALESVGAGDIAYECREKASAAGQYEWVFAGPMAELTDRQGRSIGRYAGPPATWTASDGSAITGTQLAVAPAGEGNIPLQLVKANPATGQGVMSGISHIQRVATRGGVAPTLTCDAAGKGKREVVKYQADYIFWKAM